MNSVVRGLLFLVVSPLTERIAADIFSDHLCDFSATSTSSPASAGQWLANALRRCWRFHCLRWTCIEHIWWQATVCIWQLRGWYYWHRWCVFPRNTSQWQYRMVSDWVLLINTVVWTSQWLRFCYDIFAVVVLFRLIRLRMKLAT